MTSLEKKFAPFRYKTIGSNHHFQSPYGRQRIYYADWTASGRLYQPIEDILLHKVGPLVGNTHTETSVTGKTMTKAYEEARAVIKRHVHANPDDILITTGTGMTGAMAKLQRILGLRIPSEFFRHAPRQFGKDNQSLFKTKNKKPVVFITHMEHHSNHTSWLETIADVVVVPPDENGLVSPLELQRQLQNYDKRLLKIGSFTACSNVTGITTPYHDLARVMHQHGGICIVDFAASAPYTEINMYPPHDPDGHLDAVVFSPHKFLGGPGSSGVLVLGRHLYNDDNAVPDHPGGGTVLWTNAWNEKRYSANPEIREDGGTPGFLQVIRAGLAVRLKEQMGVTNMHARDRELLDRALPALRQIPGLVILDDKVADQSPQHRLPIISFVVENLHYNLLVRLLNDRFGIQVRGGCSCAGTYGHRLLNLSRSASQAMTDLVDRGDNSTKVGWVRLSLHPTMSNAEVDFIVTAIAKTVESVAEWKKPYVLDKRTAEFRFCKNKIDDNNESHYSSSSASLEDDEIEAQVRHWFDLGGGGLPPSVLNHVTTSPKDLFSFTPWKKVTSPSSSDVAAAAAAPTDCHDDDDDDNLTFCNTTLTLGMPSSSDETSVTSGTDDDNWSYAVTKSQASAARRRSRSEVAGALWKRLRQRSHGNNKGEAKHCSVIVVE